MLRLLLTTNPFATYCDTWDEPDDGWGGVGDHAVQVHTLDHPDVAKDIAVYLPHGDEPVPVIVFVHGWLADSHDRYDFLLNRLASNGYAVVFPTYDSDRDTSHDRRFEQIETGVALAQGEHGDRLDLSRVVYAGHSFGGGAAPEIARRGLDHGWGQQGLGLFSMAPWFSYGTDYDQLPDHTVLVVQMYADDDIVDPRIARDDVWERVPAQRRSWQVIDARDTSECRSPAGHLVPGTHGGNTWIRGQRAQRLDAQDVWSIGRRLHATAALVAGNEYAHTIALGNDPDDPAVRVLAQPRVRDGAFLFPWSERAERDR